MSDSDEAEILYYIWKTKIKKRKNSLARNIFMDRKTLGEFYHLQPQLENDDLMFYRYYRMSKSCYDLLVSKIKPFYHCRKSISFEEKLTITIRYLATGENYHSASFRFRISHIHIEKIISEMLSLMYSALVEDYLKIPTKEDFVKISEGFIDKKHFPNCLGAVVGKHIRIQKLSHSIVLLATIDANYVFTMIDVGSYGENIGGCIFNSSNFGKMFHNGQLLYPENKPIDESGKPLPYVFLGDETCRLSEHILKAYPKRELNVTARKYNYRFFHSRQIVECTFDILVSKFRIFENSIHIYREKVNDLIKAACVLHNFIRIEEKSNEEFETVNSGAFTNLTNLSRYIGRSLNQSSREARFVRDKFAEYFSGQGSVEWQDDTISTKDEVQQINIIIFQQ